ncbi:MAG: transposase [Planctomycetaceae bacterium]
MVWVAETLGLKDDLGVKSQSRHLKNQESCRAFLSGPSHRFQFVFLPKLSRWLNQIEVVFGMMHRKLLRRDEFRSVSDLEDQLELF